MVKERKYKVTGSHKGKKIDIIVQASSKRQAKIKAGFRYGFGGVEMSGFMNSRQVKVRKVK